MRRSLRALGLAATAALLAVSCGSDDDESSGTEAADEGAATTAASEDTGAATTAGAETEETTATEDTEAEGGADTTAAEEGGEEEGGAGPATGEPLRIGFVNQDAGAVGTFPEIRLGMESAVEYINTELGGVDGHPIELVNCSTEGTPESTQSCAEEMVSADPLYVGVGIDFFGAVGYPVITGAGIPVWGSLPLSTQESALENVYFNNAGNASTTIGEVPYILENLPEVTHVALVTNTNAASQASIPFVQAPLEGNGIEVTVVNVPDEQTDYLGAYTQAVESGANAIIVNTSPPGCVSLAQAAAAQGNELPIVSQVTCYTAAIGAGEEAAPAFEGWHIGLLNFDPEGDTEDAQILRDAVATFSGDDADVPPYSAVSFQNMMTMYNNVLTTLGWDGLVNEDGTFNREALVEQLNEPGTLFLGEDYQCGLDPFPSACDYHSGWYTIGPAPELVLEDQLGGEMIDTRALVEEYVDQF